jgi:NRPS condensation-like uncharacterized protein
MHIWTRRSREQQFIHTLREDEQGEWYALDNAAIIMPAVANEITTSLFRFEAELDAPIDVDVMGRALELTVRRMPYFNVRLRRGFFWYYFEPCHTLPHLYPDSPSPSQLWDINKRGTRLFRIRCEANRVGGEFSHALTDGTGGMAFLKTLLANYFLLKGILPGAELGDGEFRDILTSQSFIEKMQKLGHGNSEKGSPPETEPLTISSDEFEDAYQRHFPKGLPFPDTSPNAFHMKFKRLPKGQYRVISGELNLVEVLSEARRRGVSLTELMTAVYLDALQQIWHETVPRPKENYIAVEVPLNLRTMFPSRTFRNFSLFVLIMEDMRLGMRSFEELVMRTHYQMKLEYDRMSIAKHLSRNAGSARNLIVRAVPLFLKDVFARIFFAKFGESMLSGFISNLGQVKMPPGFAPHIQRFGFIPAPSLTTLTNASMLSWNDTLIIDFGSLTESRELERLFFRRLRSLGLQVRVSCRLDQTEAKAQSKEESNAILS